METKAAETALTTVEDEQRLLEREKLKSERKKLRLAGRIDFLKGEIAKIKANAAKRVRLQDYVFLPDEELTAKGLTAQQIAIVRQWEQPKRNAAYACESSSKLIEAETRAAADKKPAGINVETLIVKLPEKGGSDLPAPIYIDVEVK